MNSGRAIEVDAFTWSSTPAEVDRMKLAVGPSIFAPSLMPKVETMLATATSPSF